MWQHSRAFMFVLLVMVKILVFTGEPDMKMLEMFHEYQEKAEIYYLYHSIHRYTVNIINYQREQTKHLTINK